MVRAVDHEDHTEPGGSDLFDGYLEPDRPHAGAFDEMFHRDGRVRSAYRALHSAIAPTAATDLAVRAEALDRAFLDRGITFSLSGQERPFPLDLVPRVIAAAEWSKLAARDRAAGAGAGGVPRRRLRRRGRSSRDGVVPRRLITSCDALPPRRGRARTRPTACASTSPASTSSATSEGTFRVLEDNLRIPSGVSLRHGEPPGDGPRASRPLRQPARARRSTTTRRTCCAPCARRPRPNVADPTVVVLTPGVYNSAYFEHALLARQMGVELVEGRDLFCRDNAVYMRTTAGEQQVDVIYRRIDDDFLDPLHFRPDSVLGVAGLSTRPARATSRSPTRSATASPTTSSSTPTSRT